MAQYDVDLRDYWRIIKKRKLFIVILIILAGITSFSFAKLKEPTPLYKADSAIKIDQSANLATLLTGGYWSQSENLVTRAYIITSFPVLELTAKELGWLPRNLSAKEIRASRTYSSAIKRLGSKISTEHEKGTNIIKIQVISESPHEAALIANSAASAYHTYNTNQKNKKTLETKTFIEEQLIATEQKLKLAERKLRDFEEESALVSMDSQTDNLLGKLFSVEAEYDRIEREKNEAESQLKILGQEGKISRPELENALLATSKNSPVFGLKQKLGDLLLERQTLLVNYTEEHPRVMEMNDRIEALIKTTTNELSAYLGTLQVREKDLQEDLTQLRRENLNLPEKGLRLARLQREVELQAELYSQLKTKHQETQIQQSGRIEEISIVSPAVRPSAPFNIPSKFMIVITGIVMGLVLGIVFAFGAEVFDTSIGTIEDIEELLEVPVLGVIPFLDEGDREVSKDEDPRATEHTRQFDLITHYDPKSLAAEAFRALRTNLQFTGLEIKGKSFLITSSFVQEGKTLNVVNLALSMAQGGDKVLLVETDLRKPFIHKIFGLPREPGLTDYILGNYSLDEITNNISDIMLGDFKMDDILRTPGLDNLSIITAGTRPPNPSEILSSERFDELLKGVYNRFSFIFFDAPPVLPVADATEIAPRVDGVILIYTVGKIARGVLKRAKATLDNVDAKVLGVILNSVKPEVGPDYFRYHTQYYYGPENEPMQENKSGFKGLFSKS